jgi:hypothetical protein
MPLKKGTEMIKDQIYALYYNWADERHYFYVGRTNDPARRLSEHRRNANNPEHTEDVYHYIRECRQPNGIDLWDMEILWSQPNSSAEDCEDFWVVLLIRAGNQLMNMKRGDLHRIALEMLSKQQGEFTDVDEFVEFKQRVEREDKERLAYERSDKLRNEVLDETPGDPLLREIIQENARRFREANAANRLREEKKIARARANAREKEEFLRNVRERNDGQN